MSGAISSSFGGNQGQAILAQTSVIARVWARRAPSNINGRVCVCVCVCVCVSLSTGFVPDLPGGHILVMARWLFGRLKEKREKETKTIGNRKRDCA